MYCMKRIGTLLVGMAVALGFSILFGSAHSSFAAARYNNQTNYRHYDDYDEDYDEYGDLDDYYDHFDDDDEDDE